MAKFIYKLQNILDVKLKVENQAKTQFAMASTKLKNEEEKLQRLIMVKEKYEQQSRDILSDHLDFTTLARLSTGISKALEDINNQQINIKVANKNLDYARLKLDEAIKERKIYEKLKEKAFEDFKHELNEQEKKEIDELVSFQYGSKVRTDGE